MALCVAPMAPPPAPGTTLGAPCSLLFSIDDEERQAACSRQEASLRLDALRERLAMLTEPGPSPFAHQLQRDVRRLLRVLSSDGSGAGADVVALASRLALMGYVVTLRTAIGGGPSCFRNLRHEFVAVSGEDAEAQYIVDPRFREQFEIPQPTATYSAVLAQLPQEFVGTPSRLIPLVQCLCAEMVASFEAMGLTLPPWRRHQSMLSKWLPSRSRDVSVGAGAPAAAAAAQAGCCSGSDGEAGGSSPTASDAAAAAGGDCAAFSRISELEFAERCGRQGSMRSLLSGKLSASAGSGLGGSALVRSGSGLGCSSSRGAGGSIVRTRSGPPQQQQQQQLPHQQQLPGMVSMQPSQYKGMPPTFKVKMGAALLPRQ